MARAYYMKHRLSRRSVFMNATHHTRSLLSVPLHESFPLYITEERIKSEKTPNMTARPYAGKLAIVTGGSRGMTDSRDFLACAVIDDYT